MVRSLRARLQLWYGGVLLVATVLPFTRRSTRVTPTLSVAFTTTVTLPDTLVVPPLGEALKKAIERLPKVEGTGGEIAVSRELVNLLNLADKEAQKRGDQFIASEMFLLAVIQDKGETGTLLRQHGASRAALEQAIAEVRGGDKVSSAEAEGSREALKKYTMDLTERARQLGAVVLLEPREGPSGWRSVISSPEAGEVALWEPKR